MMRKLTCFCAVAGMSLLVVVFPVRAQEPDTLSDGQKVDDLRQLLHLIRNYYGPLEMKEEGIGVKLDILGPKYQDLVIDTPDDTSFHGVLDDLVNEFHDGHFFLLRPDNRRANLNFLVWHVEGTALISSINRRHLSGAVFPFQIGDELVTMDGEPVTKVAMGLGRINCGRPELETVLKYQFLTLRIGSQMRVPSGDVRLGLRRVGQEKVEEIVLPWIVTGEVLPSRPIPSDPFLDSLGTGEKQLEDLEEYPREEEPLAPEQILARAQGVVLLGLAPARSDLVPADARWVANPRGIPAYTFTTSKGPVGYLRIADYYFPGGRGRVWDDLMIVVSAYRDLLMNGMKDTVALVIDQRGNLGGTAQLACLLSTLFLARPVPSPQCFERITREWLLRQYDIAQAPDLSEEIRNRAAIKYRVGVAAWKVGVYDTPFYPMDMIPEQLVPDPVFSYTRPKLLLVDEYCMSAGDMFPSLLQDSGSARLMGQRTSGAGGGVERAVKLVNSAVQVILTTMLFNRADGKLVENQGVTPEIEYQVTVDDVRNGMRGYREAMLKELVGNLPDAPSAAPTPAVPASGVPVPLPVPDLPPRISLPDRPKAVPPMPPGPAVP